MEGTGLVVDLEGGLGATVRDQVGRGRAEDEVQRQVLAAVGDAALDDVQEMAGEVGLRLLAAGQRCELDAGMGTYLNAFIRPTRYLRLRRL